MDIQLTSGTLTAGLKLPKAAVIHSVNSGSDAHALPQSLQNPLGLPQLHQCVVPGDRVVIAVDPETPDVASVISQVWDQIVTSGAELDVTVLLPYDSSGTAWKQLIEEFPIHLRNQAAVHMHDPQDELQRRYLASSGSGTRIYLSHHLIDADLIVSVGVIGFDVLLGYRGTNSGLFPAFSDPESVAAVRRPGQTELTPDDRRPQRDLVDEVGWLLGTQFTVQIIPDASGHIGSAWCGTCDMVAESARAVLNDQWRIRNQTQSPLVVVTIPGAVPQVSWKQLAAALETACRLVEEDGRIAVVADLAEPTGPGWQMLQRCRDANDLLKPLRLEPTEDAVEVTQFINALQHARIYLLSRLKEELVDDLGMLPLSSETELQKLIDSSDHVTIVPNANYAWVQTETPAPKN